MEDRVTESESGKWTSSATRLRGLTGFALATGALAFHLLSFRWIRGPGWRNQAEARAELARLVKEHQSLSYNGWVQRIGQTKRVEFTSRTGIWYQARIEPVWDDKPGGAVRVLFAIDDGGVGAYHPLTESLLLNSGS